MHTFKPIATYTASTNSTPVLSRPKQKGGSLTVYRGTGNSLFHSVNSYGIGTYYSLDKSYAQNFGVVNTYSLSLNNPLVINSQNDLDTYTRSMLLAGGSDLGQWAKSKGYDGIIDRQTDTVLKVA